MEKSSSLGQSLQMNNRLKFRKQSNILSNRPKITSDISLKTLKPNKIFDWSSFTNKNGTQRINMTGNSQNFLDFSYKRKFQHLPIAKSFRKILRAPQFPLKAKDCLQHYKSELTQLQLTEIFDYQDIFFIGKSHKKIQTGFFDNNFGYDNQELDYRIIRGDHIAFRYQIQNLLGKGSFGQVIQSFDHKRKQRVAIKIIKNKMKFHKQAGIQIKILQKFKDLPTKAPVVQIKNYFMFRKHVCIVFQLLTINLYQFLKKNSFQGLSLPLIKRFAQQVLECLKLSRQMSVIHCDLKPENIMLETSSKSVIKVIDFGAACLLNERVYTYIQSRFYRAPEVILGIPYTMAIDMWSLGCILAELFISFPLFPGESQQDQFFRILQVKGLPPQTLIEKATRKSIFFNGEQPRIFTNRRGKKRSLESRPLEKILSLASYQFVDFVDRCLMWDPEERMTPIEALGHPWIASSRKLMKIRKGGSHSQSYNHLT